MRRHADDAGLDVVDLHDLDQEEFADVGPAGFIAAIARAEIVYTDSFHAGIFALLNRRPVVLRTRFEQDPRWQELLSQNASVDPADGRRRPAIDHGRRLGGGRGAAREPPRRVAGLPARRARLVSGRAG